MPRRKRTTGLNERHRKVRRRDDNDEEEEDNTFVISDSNSDEEEEDCAMKMTPRAARRMEREKKTQVQDMTEDEMLDLALRLSKQEANTATRKEQVEDDDVKKAIAESLQVSCSQVSEMSSKQAKSATVAHQDTVTAHVRCKLSFPSKDVKDSGTMNDKDTAAQTSTSKGLEEGSPLKAMPDLSQTILSQTSPASPTLPSVHSAASHEFHPSHLAKQAFNADSPEDEPSQSDTSLQKDEPSESDSSLQKSPVSLRQCSIRLSTNKLLKNILCTNDRSLSLTSPDCSPNSHSPPPKSPVFPKTDSKKCTTLKQNKLIDCTSSSSFTDSVCKPEDTFQNSSSHKCKDSSKHHQQNRKAQPSLHVSVPEDDKQEAVKDESSRGTGLRSVTVTDRAPDTDNYLPADTRSLDEFTSHMILHLSDDDDDDNDNDEKIIPPSPVFPQDHASCAEKPKLSPTQPCCSSPLAITTQDSFQTKSPAQAESQQAKFPRKSADSRKKEESIVSYYWGVPFCPRGQHPDDYTQVILAQLEVYEKSLKEAQRQLLHKVEWGLPVFPCPVERAHGRRLKRHRVPQLLEEEEEDERLEEEEKEKRKKVEWKDREQSQGHLEEGENGQQETYVVLSSPEPQEELGRKSPLLFRQQEPITSATPSSCRKPVFQDLSVNTQRHSEPTKHGEDFQNGRFDVESSLCPETQMTEDNTPELMVTSPEQPALQPETEIMEVDEVTEQTEAEERMEQERPDEEQSWRESVPSQVECPMCTRCFPLAKIEMHAAYCNGTVEDQDHDQQETLSQGSSRRKKVRRPAMEDVRFEKSEQEEKCFLCNKFVPCSEYSHHVDQCLQQKTLGPKQGNGLLSALNRTESVHLDDSGPGPSNTTIKNNRSIAGASVIPPPSVDSQSPAYYVSSSPIKSFTPISELTDCLINFRQQYSDRTSQRLGRKRKFKR